MQSAFSEAAPIAFVLCSNKGRGAAFRHAHAPEYIVVKQSTHCSLRWESRLMHRITEAGAANDG
jgi:hypothetical protein